MIVRGQSKKARATRVALGCCPTHGLFMSQHTPYLSESDAKKFGFIGPEESVCLARCPRKDCETYALARGPEEVVRVLTAAESLIAKELAIKKIKKFHTFAHLIKAEHQAKKELTPDEWEECYQLSHREPS
jgi:hypothetical protein